MKFSYKFSNLLGTIYHKGNLVFTPDGNSIISPVGNRITIINLKNNKAKTLSLQSKFNYSSIGLSENGLLLLAVNEEGEGQLISLITCNVIHRHKFFKEVKFIKFSPNGKYFIVAYDDIVLIFKAPGEITGEYNTFRIVRSFIGAYDDITYIDWSTDSRFIAIGSRDNTTRIYSINRYKNFRPCILTGHTASVIGCFFENESLHMNTISESGQLCLWKCNLKLSNFIEQPELDNEETHLVSKRFKEMNTSSSEEEDDIDSSDEVEKDENKEEKSPDEGFIKYGNQDEDDEKIKTKNSDTNQNDNLISYKKLCRHYLINEAKKENPNAHVTAVAYHKKISLLVVAFSTGSFCLYELPEVNMIQSLSLSDYAISAVCFNVTGDWIALATSSVGQLLVWEWQSEQYIMKQQGHLSEMTCITYSSDGHIIASGGEDSKIKLWNVINGFCFVTFHEHSSSVTGIQFSRNKQFLVSSSLDGTVRAFDIIRYRNFRTLTTPRPVQFSCVAIDYSDELVVAGGQDIFEIYLWSMKLGKLLEIISGHEGPVTSLEFSPIPTSTTLISGSWDKTVRIWNCIETSGKNEIIDVLADVVCVAFKPNGEEFAVSTLNGNILFFDIKTSQQTGSIEGRNDLGSGVSDTDVVSAKKNLEGKTFNTIVYTADGENILAAGRSANVCIYNVKEGILLKTFTITQNRSLDGIDEFINRRKLTEFGNIALIERRDTLEGGNVEIRLPGVQKGDMASRSFKPEVKVFCIRFSPTGQSWAAATTEGLLLYSLDDSFICDPYNLSLDVTPRAAKQLLENQEYTNALIMALKLNEINLIQMIFESIPYKQVDLVSSLLSVEYAKKALHYISKFIQSTKHIEFYLMWSTSILTHHGGKDKAFDHPILLEVQESLTRKYKILNKTSNFGKYTLRAILSVHEENKGKLEKFEEKMSDESSDEIEKEDDSEDDEMNLIKQNNKATEDFNRNSEFIETSDSDDD